MWRPTRPARSRRSETTAKQGCRSGTASSFRSGPPDDSAVLTCADGFKVIVGNKGGKSVDIKGSRKPDPKDLGPEDKAKFDAMPDPPPLVAFADAIRTRQQAGGNAESPHRMSTALNLANIAIRVGRTIEWDPVAEKIVGDEEAGRFIDVPMRGEWHV